MRVYNFLTYPGKTAIVQDGRPPLSDNCLDTKRGRSKPQRIAYNNREYGPIPVTVLDKELVSKRNSLEHMHSCIVSECAF